MSEKVKEVPERRIYLDLLRIVSCIAVVLFHICGRYNHFYQINEYERIVSTSITVVTGFAVPVFLMISGTIFLDQGYKVNIKKIYKKNILKLIVIYFVWSILYLCVCGKEFGISEVVNGHYHMWYIPAMIGVYMAVPLLRPIVADKTVLTYFLIFGFGLNCIFLYIRHLSLLSPLLQMVDKFALNIPKGYIFYFVLGYAVTRFKFTNRQKYIVYAMAVVDCVFVICLSIYLAIKKGIQLDCLYSNFSISRLLFSVALFIFFKDMADKIEKEIMVRAIKYVSGCTLGIYLIHDLVIQGVDAMINIMNLNPLWAIVFVGIMVFGISFGLVAIIKKIPVIGKIIV